VTEATAEPSGRFGHAIRSTVPLGRHDTRNREVRDRVKVHILLERATSSLGPDDPPGILRKDIGTKWVPRPMLPRYSPLTRLEPNPSNARQVTMSQ
jgi:hypothetical protein